MAQHSMAGQHDIAHRNQNFFIEQDAMQFDRMSQHSASQQVTARAGHDKHICALCTADTVGFSQ
jgi:hypothetical protein